MHCVSNSLDNSSQFIRNAWSIRDVFEVVEQWRRGICVCTWHANGERWITSCYKKTVFSPDLLRGFITRSSYAVLFVRRTLGIPFQFTYRTHYWSVSVLECTGKGILRPRQGTAAGRGKAAPLMRGR